MSKKLKVVVKKDFIDRHTGLKRKRGDYFSVSEERYREIKRSGEYVEIVPNGNQETKPEKTNVELKK